MSFKKTAFVGIDSLGRSISVGRITRQLYADSIPITGCEIKSMREDAKGKMHEVTITYVTGQKLIPGVLSHTHAPTIIYPVKRGVVSGKKWLKRMDRAAVQMVSA